MIPARLFIRKDSDRRRARELAAPQLELGRHLRRARVAAGLSYRGLHDSSGLAVSHLQRLERGTIRRPDPAVLRRLAEALGLDHAALMRAAGYL